jgi:hypothetical protein
MTAIHMLWSDCLEFYTGLFSSLHFDCLLKLRHNDNKFNYYRVIFFHARARISKQRPASFYYAASDHIRKLCIYR